MDFTPPELLIGLVPLWMAAAAGMLIGWSWRPRCRWAAALVTLAAKSRSRLFWTGFTPRRVNALSVFSFFKRIIRRCKSSSNSAQKAMIPPETSSDGVRAISASSSLSDSKFEHPGLTEADLESLISYIHETDGGPPWQLIMEQSTPTLAYQAWRRDPEFAPAQYRTRTIIQNVPPELMKDFFWDDNFRTKWDGMLIYYRTLNECPQTGTMIVHWIRKFPFFYSDREYIIIRRIWEFGSTFYCISKGTQYPSLPRHRSRRQVDLYYSSWRIKAVESRNGGQLTACEVLLFHYEEMGIPKELAKTGIMRGMWGLIRKLDAGVQAYHAAQANGVPPSRYAIMARITTKIPSLTSTLPQLGVNNAEEGLEHVEIHDEPKKGGNVLKWFVVGGILILCGLNGGAIGKGIIFGIVRRICQNDSQKVAGNKESKKR